MAISLKNTARITSSRLHVGVHAAQLCGGSGRKSRRAAKWSWSARRRQTAAFVGLQSYTFDEDFTIEVSYLSVLRDRLTGVRDSVLRLLPDEQVAVFEALPNVQAVMAEHRKVAGLVARLPADQKAAVLATIAAEQEHVVTVLPDSGDWEQRFRELAADLVKVQAFYDSLGGIVGYQLKCLELIIAARAEELSDAENGCSSGDAAESDHVEYLIPQGPNLQGAQGRAVAQRAAADGLRAMPQLAEIYPLGGAGDRLGLLCEDTGEPLPAAMLPYAGRPIFERLLRDLCAREYLYYRVFDEQLTTPVAIMTSDAKGNHQRVCQMLEEQAYFGRPRGSFRLFNQPLVPVLEASTGRWVLPEALAPSMKPGGHGAIWKLMHDHGVFEWLEGAGRTAALVRQISNPMAATDCTLLALAGTGHRGRRAFGFASCDRVVGAAEGMNVLRRERVAAPCGSGAHRAANGATENSSAASNGAAAAGERPVDAARGNGGGGGYEYQYGVTNVEYTEFQRLGIQDVSIGDGSNQSCFPANTNILYVGLRPAAEAVRRGIELRGGASLPGMIFNLKKQITYTPAGSHEPRSVQAGRMECTMQNLADSLMQRCDCELSDVQASSLDTFVVFNERRYVTSSAKRARQPGSDKIHQTPEGSFLDLMRNARDMLALCDVETPELGSDADYVASGCAPAFVWLWNPALGPLWQVVAQKIRGGELAPRAHVELEIAELRWRDVHVDGSLRVIARDALGRRSGASAGGSAHAAAPHDSSGQVVFSDACGRARLEGVRVRNAGIDYDAPGTCHWKQAVRRREACTVVLEGRSEFCACDVELRGNVEFVVPDGQGMLVRLEPVRYY